MNKLKANIRFLLYKKMIPLRAKRLYRAVVKRKSANSMIVWLGPGFGDVIYGMAYLSEWKTKNPGRKLVIIALEKSKNLIDAYGGGYDDVIYISGDSKYRKYLTAFWSCKKTVQDGQMHGFISTLIPYWIGIDGAPDALYIIRNTLLRVGDNVRVQYHQTVPTPPSNAHDFEESSRRTVLLNSYSLSTVLSNSQVEYFEKVCAFLVQHGYTVYSNVIGDQKNIKGSIPLQCSLSELLWIANRALLIVSVRSGILDFLIKTPINMFVIYSENLSSVYTLKAWGGKGELMEVAGRDIENDEKIHIFKKFFERLE